MLNRTTKKAVNDELTRFEVGAAGCAASLFTPVQARSSCVNFMTRQRACFANCVPNLLSTGTCTLPQIETGYRLEVVTVRKLEFENDAFGFADKIVEKCAHVQHLHAAP